MQGRLTTFMMATILTLTWVSTAPGIEDIEEFRKRYSRETKDLQDVGNNRARKLRRSDGTIDRTSKEYQKIQQDYNAKKQALRKKYLSKHPASKAWKELKNLPDGKKLKSTGSDNVSSPFSDMDITAADRASAKAAAKHLKNKGHNVTYDPDSGIYLDHTTDTKIWEPWTPENQRARANNPEGYTRSGAMDHENIPSPDAQYDPEGYVEDLKKKYEAAKKAGDTRSKNKLARKMQEAIGKKPDTVTKKMSVDADPFESGESTFGESEAVRKTRASERAEAMDKQVQEARETARKQSKSQKRQFKDFAKQNRDLGNKKSAEEYTEANKKIERTTPKSEEVRLEKKLEQTNKDLQEAKKSGNQEKIRKASNKAKRTPRELEDLRQGKVSATDIDGPSATDPDGPGVKKTAKTKPITDPDGPGVSSGKPKSTKHTGKKGASIDPNKTTKGLKKPETMAGKAGRISNEYMEGAVLIHQAKKVRDGLKEGDNKKVLEGLAGQDIADRSDVSGGKDYVDAKGAEADSVSAEAEAAVVAKLKRMGATPKEIEEYRKNYGKDGSKTREIVNQVKSRGGKDEKGHKAIEGMSAEEDSWTPSEQLKEGVKQAGSYGETVLDGASLGGVSRGKQSQSDLDSAVADADHVWKQAEENVKSKLYTELRDRGATKTEAREAVKDYFKDKSGVQDLMAVLKKRDPEKAKGSERKKDGLTTDNVDIEDDGEGAVERVKKSFSDAGKTMKEVLVDTPREYVKQAGKDIADATHDALEVIGVGSVKNREEKNAAERNAEAAAQRGMKIEKLVKLGATKEEAETAVDGKHGEVSKLTKQLLKKNAEKKKAEEEKIGHEKAEKKKRDAIEQDEQEEKDVDPLAQEEEVSIDAEEKEKKKRRKKAIAEEDKEEITEEEREGEAGEIAQEDNEQKGKTIKESASSPPSTDTFDEEMGEAENSKGKTKLIYTKNKSNGSIIRITEIDYDPLGNEIERRITSSSGDVITQRPSSDDEHQPESGGYEPRNDPSMGFTSPTEEQITKAGQKGEDYRTRGPTGRIPKETTGAIGDGDPIAQPDSYTSGTMGGPLTKKEKKHDSEGKEETDSPQSERVGEHPSDPNVGSYSTTSNTGSNKDKKQQKAKRYYLKCRTCGHKIYAKSSKEVDQYNKSLAIKCGKRGLAGDQECGRACPKCGSINTMIGGRE